MKAKRKYSFGAIGKRLSHYLKDKKHVIFFVALALITSTIFAIFAPVVTKDVTDSIADSIAKNADIDFPYIRAAAADPGRAVYLQRWVCLLCHYAHHLSVATGD